MLRQKMVDAKTHSEARVGLWVSIFIVEPFLFNTKLFKHTSFRQFLCESPHYGNSLFMRCIITGGFYFILLHIGVSEPDFHILKTVVNNPWPRRETLCIGEWILVVVCSLCNELQI